MPVTKEPNGSMSDSKRPDGITLCEQEARGAPADRRQTAPNYAVIHLVRTPTYSRYLCSVQSPYLELLRSQRRVSIRCWSRLLLYGGIVAITAVLLFTCYQQQTLHRDATDGVPHVDNRGQLLHLSMSSMLTADEMYYATFGQSSNSSSSSSSSSSPIWSEWSPDARRRYLNYVQSHIAKPTQSRRKKQWSSVNRKPNVWSALVDRELNGLRNGFFVECGAYDGNFQSNTLFLELERNWTGLLVEASRIMIPKLLRQRRSQSYIFAGCLSPRRQPGTLQFKSADGLGGLTEHLTEDVDSLIKTYRKVMIESVDYVQCFPLGDLLAAIGIDRVHYLSLDVHGAELPILETLDLDQVVGGRQVRVDIINVELFANGNATKKEAMFGEMRRFFARTGLYRELESPSDYDLVFSRRVP